MRYIGNSPAVSALAKHDGRTDISFALSTKVIQNEKSRSAIKSAMKKYFKGFPLEAGLRTHPWTTGERGENERYL